MESWYIAFNAYGTPQDILVRLLQSVKELQLGNSITRFCYEKGVNKKRAQFYVFIGVISKEKGLIPEEMQNSFNLLLQRLRFTDKKLYVSLDEVKRMVSRELEIHNLRKIKMLHFSTVSSPTDPYHFTNSDQVEGQYEDRQNAYNNLLYWLSAFGFGSWQQFRNVCEKLGLDSTGDYSRGIARRLRSLGHIEMVNEGQNWVISPACFVETQNNDGQFHAFLAGQRTPGLIRALEQEGCIENEPHPYGDAPEIIRVTLTSKESAELFIQKYRQNQQLYLAGYSGLKIACALPDLSVWEKRLPKLEVPKDLYSFEQWADNGFIPAETPKETGLFKLTHISSKFEHPQLTLFYNYKDDAWRKADWYGLRYLMMRRTGVPIKFYYDHKLKRLCIAKENRPPDIYERSLVLASGRLPLFGDKYVIFGDVSDTIAHVLSTKLEAEYVEFVGGK